MLFGPRSSDEDVLHPVFDLTTEELDEHWDYLDTNEDGILSRQGPAGVRCRISPWPTLPHVVASYHC